MKALYMLTDANAEAEMFRMMKQQVQMEKILKMLCVQASGVHPLKSCRSF